MTGKELHDHWWQSLNHGAKRIDNGWDLLPDEFKNAWNSVANFNGKIESNDNEPVKFKPGFFAKLMRYYSDCWRRIRGN